MSHPSGSPPWLVRQRFTSSAQEPRALDAQILLQLLLHQDGSTTRLLELLAACSITVHVLEQELVRELPPQLAGVLPGKTFLRRLSTLEAHGRVLLDSLSYTAADVLSPSTLGELLGRTRPIGHVLAETWTRRVFRLDDTQLLDELWAAVGAPDPQASRSILISTPKGPCMVLAETFRQGVLDSIRQVTAR